ncbi:hypothetical protein Acr_00g0075720 [Actinidia rufa]|uniref:Uncharacterized protein n=1 Tax=Actinidia rufa TaxID=165716 RepID=A0A7J0DU25_9ERIC|nr:hypothetical protein Acr_00g0075720 [Actinidia rufa]
MAFAASSGSGPRSFGGKVPHRTATIADTSHGHAPDLSHIQSQCGQLQSQLSSRLQQHPSGLIATLATGTPTAFYAKTGHFTWVLNSGANNHMTDKLSISSHVVSIHQTICLADGSSSTIQHKRLDFEEDFWQGI